MASRNHGFSEERKPEKISEVFNTASSGIDADAYSSALEWYLGAGRQGRSVAQNGIVELYDFGLRYF